MTLYAEVTARRIGITAELDRRVCAGPTHELPEQQQAQLRRADQANGQNVNGVMFQRCGGGRRVIKKRIGGN